MVESSRVIPQKLQGFKVIYIPTFWPILNKLVARKISFLYSSQKARVFWPLRVQKKRDFGLLLQKNLILPTPTKKESPRSQFAILGFASDGNLHAIWDFLYFRGLVHKYTIAYLYTFSFIIFFIILLLLLKMLLNTGIIIKHLSSGNNL